MDAQATLPTMDWPALVAGPVFLCFELKGAPQHKQRHRSRLVIPKEAWTHTQTASMILKKDVNRLFIHNYTEKETEAFEATIAEAAGLFMRGKPMTEKPVAFLMHVFKEIPKSWTKTEKAQALAGYIRPTSKPDDDNYLKIRDAMDGIVWKDDSQCVDSRVIKLYSDRPGMRFEVREMLPPDGWPGNGGPPLAGE